MVNAEDNAITYTIYDVIDQLLQIHESGTSNTLKSDIINVLPIKEKHERAYSTDSLTSTESLASTVSSLSATSSLESEAGTEVDFSKAFSCVCGKVFSSYIGLKSHSKIHIDSRERNFVCETCKKAFFRKQDLKRHETTHLVDYHPYSVCVITVALLLQEVMLYPDILSLDVVD
ncbi:hypothetical protein HDU92_006245 [Lobulomyces angularis]|nr:hypothetical protein HDU92_006245 [Lobulomyces angularis]